MGEKLTITEALAEIKLLTKKIGKKRDFVRDNALFATHQPDPFVTDGGRKDVLTKELQAIKDLWTRWVTLRTAINKTNVTEQITVGEETKTIAQWLIWRREIANDQVNFYETVSRDILVTLKQKAERPEAKKNDDTGEFQFVKWESAVDANALRQQAERLQTMLDELDGKLSLKNATLTVYV